MGLAIFLLIVGSGFLTLHVFMKKAGKKARGTLITSIVILLIGGMGMSIELSGGTQAVADESAAPPKTPTVADTKVPKDQEAKDAKAAEDVQKAKGDKEKADKKAKEDKEKAAEAKKLNEERAKIVDYGTNSIDYYNSLGSQLDKYDYAKQQEAKCLEYFGSDLSKGDDDFQTTMAVGRSAWAAVQSYLENPGSVAKQSKANQAVIQYQVHLAQAGIKYLGK